MSWASRRRLMYIIGVIVFFGIVIGGPIAYHFLTIPATCHDGKQNQGETSIDAGGPCLLLNPADLQPQGVLWARSFLVRPGLTDAVAYIDNPNKTAGVLQAPYELDVYDSQNTLIQDVTGTTFIMPGGVTPVFIGNISNGNRLPVHAQFTLKGPLTWIRVLPHLQGVQISNQVVTSAASSSQITAQVTNTSVSDIHNITFVATVFDAKDDSIATSQTALQDLPAGGTQKIYFTWPSNFSAPVGQVDIIPVIAPQPDPAAAR